MYMSRILWFRDCHYSNISLVGGKSASLGELSRIDFVNNADGFAITTNFYSNFLEINTINTKIYEIYKKVTPNLSFGELNSISLQIKNLFKDATYSQELENELKHVYDELPKPCELAVRSSAIAEDLPNASFAGQQDTYLNVTTFDSLKAAIKDCFASLFNTNAISYRLSNDINFDDIKMAVCVQKMVRSDLASAGVAFSIDPETGYSKAIVVNSSFGLGESVVGGLVTPDEFIIDKRVAKLAHKDPIVSKKMGSKKTKIVFKSDGTQEIATSETEFANFSLTNEQAFQIGNTVLKLEKYYQDLHQKNIGVDIEWAFDGKDSKLYILQVRAETVHSSSEAINIHKYFFNSTTEKRELLCEGISIGEKISSGKLVHIKTITDIENTAFNKGDILLTDMTTPDWEPIMKIAGGIITNKGGRTCHAAIVAREHQINAIIGTECGTEILKGEKMVTLSCAEGETGRVYRGKILFHIKTITLDHNDIKGQDKIMFNIGSPENCFSSSLLPNNGVGLARMEFIINNHIKIHPLELIEERKEEFFIETLSQGISKIASSFYPKDVIVRLSDFKTNEYKFLKGGEKYEPLEENPMIGWRGASRYYSKNYEQAFRLECKALKYARENMGMDNIIIMIPFCRTPEECKKVIDIMKSEGLERGVNKLRIYLMCEIPSNVIEADNFSEFIDGVSIGGNDLMQLTLGVDRDSEHVAYLNDDKNLSFRRMIQMTIETYHKHGKKVGFCGQQPSNSREFYEFLIKNNIDTISITPDTLSNLSVIN
jgi:pyruvate,water dikinase